MSDHITPPRPGTPALDYERAKDRFFEKLAADRHGRGRMESALYHTAQWIFEQGCHERNKLLAEIDHLRAALRHYIRIYRVADEAWDPEAETDRIMRRVMEARDA